MIMRHWSGKTPFDKADAYLSHLQQDTFPQLLRLDGFKGAHVLSRDHDDGVAFVVLTLWDSMAAIRRFAGEDPERAVVPAEAQALLADYDAMVTHYNLVAAL